MIPRRDLEERRDFARESLRLKLFSHWAIGRKVLEGGCGFDVVRRDLFRSDCGGILVDCDL